MAGEWTSRRAVSLHTTVLLLIFAFAALCAWQVTRALSGNDLSWAYVFEWPVFALYAVYFWWKLLHEGVDRQLPSRTAARGAGDEHDPEGPEQTEEDRELAEYNQYLSALHESGRQKRW